MGRRSLATLRALIREELRSEGIDGGGYSNTFIDSLINRAVEDLAELYTFRDRITFTTVGGQNEYDLIDETLVEPGIVIEDILRVTYDGTRLTSMTPDSFLSTTEPVAGRVRAWLLWGTTLTLVGAVEDGKSVELWITRAPKMVAANEDKPETPYYADEAIIAFAIAGCYRESRDYERASHHFAIYRHQRGNLHNRAVPQGQRDPSNHQPVSEYFPPVNHDGGSF